MATKQKSLDLEQRHDTNEVMIRAQAIDGRTLAVKLHEYANNGCKF